MTLDGKITITLTGTESGAYRAVIHSSRPVEAANILIGKRPDQVLETIPLLFGICGQAHAYAADRALRQAMAMDIDPALDRAGRFLVHLESVREHALRILLDGPRLLGMAPEPKPLAEFMGLTRRFSPWLFERGETFRLDSRAALSITDLSEGIDFLQRLIDETVFQGAMSAWLELQTETQLQVWLKQNRSLPVNLLSFLLQKGWAAIGRNAIEPLPELMPVDLLAHLHEPGFNKAPQWFGHCYETGPLSRQAEQPLLADLTARYGNGLLTRMAARLQELARMPEVLKALLVDAHECHPTDSSETGCGLAQVQAVRGLLIHQVGLRDGRVEQYRIVAPTEWNFHPAGVLAASLNALQAKDPEILQRQADWLVHAIDPCVQYEIRINTD